MIEQRIPFWNDSSSAGLVNEFADTTANIRLFNDRMGTRQPSFFISKCSWDLLVNGISRRKDGSLIQWLPANHTVYGFIFCIAFDKDHAYFRIRTILKENGVKPEKNEKGEKVLKVWIETENIAFVNITTALTNMSLEESSDRIKKDCLEFIYLRDTSAIDEISWINSQVYLKTTPEILPTNFIKIPQDKKFDEILKNEGNYFGKLRLWNKLLNTDYPQSKGTDIAIALRETYRRERYITRSMYFNFKINGNYDTNLPCPNPPICQ